MNLPFYIAKRYLFAKKSHNVINIISAISATGIGLGCMALIIILSVYNGFDTLIKSLYDTYQPDFIITPAKGKTFTADSSTLEIIKNIDNRLKICPVIEENVFATYGGNEAIAKIQGVDSAFLKTSKLSRYLIEGEFNTGEGEIAGAVVSRNLAMELGIRTRFLAPLDLYFPDRNAEISLVDPTSSLNNIAFYPTGILNLEKSYDNNSVIVSLNRAAELLGYAPEEITALYLYLDSSAFAKNNKSLAHSITNSLLGKNLSGSLAPDLLVKDRFMQNETLYKMMRAEKFAVYMILLFVIIIVSFNIFGSLSMLMIEKRKDIGILKSMGAGRKLINRIFILQGTLISATGALCGVIIGTLLAYMQAKYHTLPMPGNFIIDYYPVEIQITDILITFFGVVVVGYLIANVPIKFFKKNF